MDTALPAIDSGDTAWMITATALILLMTIPGLALFWMEFEWAAHGKPRAPITIKSLQSAANPGAGFHSLAHPENRSATRLSRPFPDPGRSPLHCNPGPGSQCDGDQRFRAPERPESAVTRRSIC